MFQPIANIYRHSVKRRAFSATPGDRRPENVRSVWIIRAGFTGDLVMMSPLPRLIKTRWPEAKLTVVVERCFADVWKYNPFIDRLLAEEITGNTMRHWRTIERLGLLGRTEGVDVLICTDTHFTARILGMLVRAAWSAGFSESVPAQPAKPWSYMSTCTGILESLRDIADAAGLSPGNAWRQELWWPPEVDRAVEELLAGTDGPKIGLVPWTSCSTKDWPLERAARFCDLMASHGRVVLLGTAAQSGRSAALQAMTKTRPLDLVGRTSILEYFALIGRMDIVVSCDTSASHLAATLDRPAVVLFGPTLAADWRPASDSIRLLCGAGGWNPERCYAGEKVVRYCAKCRFDKARCMDFSAEEVAAAISHYPGWSLDRGAAAAK